MKKSITKLSLLVLLLFVMIHCKEDMRYIDPMIYGVTGNVEKEVVALTRLDNFAIALIGLRDQRIKLFLMKKSVEDGLFQGDNYGLENKQLALQHVNDVIVSVTAKTDSVWNVNIGNAFNSASPNSLGIQNLGVNAYAAASNIVPRAYSWIMDETGDSSDGPWMLIDFINLQSSVAILASLAAMSDVEVNEFVNAVKDRFASMQAQYADLASEVATSPYFSKAQKTLYAGLQKILDDMAITIEKDLTLDTVDELDAIDRDLGGLVYFVENNYTSPAQYPLVYGEISSITELRWLSENGLIDMDYNKNWKLMVDIDAAETRRWNDGAGFRPIALFTAVFDGQYHIISGLYMNEYPDMRTGFIDDLSGEIRNLGLINVDVRTRQAVGGAMAGRVINGKITNCMLHGIAGLRGQGGGIVGRTETGQFSNCFVFMNCNVNQAANHGNFAGWSILGSTYSNCYVVGTMTGGAAASNNFVGNVSGAIEVATGCFLDSSIATKPPSNQAYFNAMITLLPTEQWGTLANFPTFSSEKWEIRTVPEIDPNPRPYLKAFNYDIIKDFIVPSK